MSDDSYLSEIDNLKKTRSRAPKGATQPTANKAQTNGPVAMVSMNVRISSEQSDLITEICLRKGWTKAYAIREAIALLGKANG